MIQGLPLRFDGDPALLGKLQSIANQIDQYLPDARRVALNLQRAHVHRNLQLQIEPALHGAVLE
ncbi:hypothetical protein D3C75_1311530 [compost metagenome]